MKAKELETVVENHFKTLKKLGLKISAHFEKEAIHDFRVTVKKLRAFLRLIKQGAKDADKLKITSEFKELYGYLGITRNLDLVEQLVYKLAVEDHNLLPVKYLQVLKTDAEDWKLKVVAMPVQDLVENERYFLLKSLPTRLTKGNIHKFLRGNKKELLALIALSQISDDQLHEVRKILKDFLYNWKYIKNDAVLILPGLLASEGNLKAITDMLGAYQDLSTALHMLETSYHDTPAYNEEQVTINVIIEKWKLHLQTIRQPILEHLKACISSSPIKPLRVSH